MKRMFSAMLPAAALLAGCVSLAPDYARPELPVPRQWRGVEAAGEAARGGAQPVSLLDVEWRSFFQDERLRQVIALGLAHNRDLRIALSNIEKARAQYRIQRAEVLPSVGADAGQSVSRSPASVSATGVSAVSRQYSAEVGFSSYELDLFGRIRSLKDEALESYLSTAAAQRSTRLSLMAEIAGDWLTLAADRELLALARETLESQRATLALSEHRHALGVVSGLDLAQVRRSVESARADAARYAAQVEQDRNALELVVGAAVPDALLPDGSAGEPVLLAQIPAGLDSTALLVRPDVVSAEHALKAANADIGAARAAFFPTISLTASGGRISSQLSDLFSGASRSWSFAPGIHIPIFDAGSLRASLDVAHAERDIAVAEYERTLQTAFREVADALSVRASMQERLAAQQALVRASGRAFQLADARYRNGMDSYLDALDAQRSLYEARQGLVSLSLTEASNRVTLYKVLGGGMNMDRQMIITGLGE
ncbi:efflux transporter outer membrane subunit [Castellaniella defragrans]|uniref:efflux transporter outer membrane subunit n=1 Tax=Castellaniella defragrans TaxID=75697 RepID=UPI0023F39270|nr:efflux transporter outer membrane subunit [Castellaniella defragrans]